MAKKSINVVERHLEKGVLALAGVVLAGSIVLYHVGTPNTMNVGGTEVGPGTVDKVVKERANQVLNNVRTHTRELPEAPAWTEKWKQYEPGPRVINKLGETLPQAAAWHSPILEVKGLEQGLKEQSIRLAKVGAPGKPLVLSGRNLVGDIPETERVLSSTFNQPINQPVNPLLPVGAEALNTQNAKDVNWATVFMTFDREAQIKRFADAGYSRRRRAVIFLWPELQRRNQLDGQWTAWEDVKTFLPYDQPETPALDQADATAAAGGAPMRVADFVNLVFGARLRIMRPAFLPTLSGKPWSIPKISDIEPELFTAEGDTRWAELIRRWDPNYVPPDTAAGQAPGQPANLVIEGMPLGQRVKITVREAERLLTANNATSAQTVIEQLLNDRQVQLPSTLLEKVLAVRDRIDEKLAVIRAAQMQRNAGQAQGGAMAGAAGFEAAAARVAGPPITLLWAHDIGPVPGAIYQYRSRIVLFNVFYGDTGSLQDPTEAVSARLVGAWSEPSEPVEIQPDVHFFVKGKPGRDVMVSVYKWFQGQWVKKDFPVAIGSKIGGMARVYVKEPGRDGLIPRKDVNFESVYTVVDLDFNRALPPGTPSKVRSKSTLSLVYLDGQNQLRERFDVLDKSSDLKKALDQEVTKKPKPRSREPNPAGAGFAPMPPAGVAAPPPLPPQPPPRAGRRGNRGGNPRGR